MCWGGWSHGSRDFSMYSFLCRFDFLLYGFNTYFLKPKLNSLCSVKKKTELGSRGWAGCLQWPRRGGGWLHISVLMLFSTGSPSSCLSHLLLHLLFASHFLLIALSFARVCCHSGNRVGTGFPPIAPFVMETEVGELL